MADEVYRSRRRDSYTESRDEAGSCCEDSSTDDHLKTKHFRIVLYKECRFKGSFLLFDTASKKHSLGRRYDQAENLENVLEHDRIGRLPEIIFGSTAMRYNDTYFKVHDVSDRHLIFTQVFSAQCTRIGPKALPPFSFSTNVWERRAISSDQFSASDTESSSKLKWLNNYNSTFSTDSGLGNQSFDSNLSSNFQMDIVNTGPKSSDLTDLSLSNYGSYASSAKQPEEASIGNFRERYSRFGIAIILSISSQKNRYKDFYLKHILYVESILNRLRYYLSCTYHNPTFFIDIMSEITRDSIQWLIDLADNMQMKRPTVVNGSDITEEPTVRMSWIKRHLYTKRDRVKTSAFELFCHTLGQFNTKEYKFFLSTLLTAVLSYHLGWVNTCIKTLSTTALRTSYNALRCQLLDTCGSMADIPRTSKTVIYGSNECTVANILRFVDYFLRYCRVDRRDVEIEYSFKQYDVVNSICDRNLCDMGKTDEAFKKDQEVSQKSVVFILGDDEKLINIKGSEDSVPKKEVTRGNRSLKMTKNKSCFSLGSLNSQKDDEVYLNRECDLCNKKDFNQTTLPKMKKKETHFSLATLDVQEENVEDVNTDCFPAVEDKNANKSRRMKMKIVMFPLPKMNLIQDFMELVPFEKTLRNMSLHKVVPDMTIQGTVVSPETWKPQIKSDVVMHNYSQLSDSTMEETAVVLGNIDGCDVEVLSNKMLSIRMNNLVESVDASELVLNMLVVLEKMWQMNIPQEWCITYIEQRLLEICLRSNAMAEILLSMDFCTIEVLTSALNVSTTDVPLLMSVASHIKPEVSKKYGISYQ